MSLRMQYVALATLIVAVVLASHWLIGPVLKVQYS